MIVARSNETSYGGEKRLKSFVRGQVPLVKYETFVRLICFPYRESVKHVQLFFFSAGTFLCLKLKPIVDLKSFVSQRVEKQGDDICWPLVSQSCHIAVVS